MREKEKDMPTKRYQIDLDNPPKMSKENLARFDAVSDENIDYSDIPDMGDIVFNFVEKIGIYTRVDADVLTWFKDQGSGYQKRMNAVLRAFYKKHKNRSNQ